MRGVHIAAADLNVDGRGQTEIKNRVYQSAGLKIDGELRKFFVNLLTHPIHQFVAAGFVAFSEAGMDESGVRRGIGGVDYGKIGSDSDVGYHHLQFIFRNDLANDVFDLSHVLFGELDAGAGRSFHVDDELSGIGAREKSAAEKRIKSQTEQ